LSDPFDLGRFVEAQAWTFDKALEELKAGRKQTHWMWFVFPQHRDLGRSGRAIHFGLASLDEARAYLAHPVLGPRLAAVTEAVIDSSAPSLHALFGSPDDLKFHSSMTLFALASGAGDNVFERALDRWCGGQQDSQTLAALAYGD
jgi:uncharacterized protein (DUF1810 family)